MVDRNTGYSMLTCGICNERRARELAKYKHPNRSTVTKFVEFTWKWRIIPNCQSNTIVCNCLQWDLIGSHQFLRHQQSKHLGDKQTIAKIISTVRWPFRKLRKYNGGLKLQISPLNPLVRFFVLWNAISRGLITLFQNIIWQYFFPHSALVQFHSKLLLRRSRGVVKQPEKISQK